jgi:HlyD family secretion protein
VKAGQQVLIKFAGYPFEEYGAVEGMITTIAQLAGNDSTFSTKVHLPAGFTTQHGKRFAYRVGMHANAEIITEDTSLLERLLHLYRKAIRSP